MRQKQAQNTRFQVNSCEKLVVFAKIRVFEDGGDASLLYPDLMLYRVIRRVKESRLEKGLIQEELAAATFVQHADIR